jgi:hypothetical protein
MGGGLASQVIFIDTGNKGWYEKILLQHTVWGYSSAGRALEWHSRGQRFDPA